MTPAFAVGQCVRVRTGEPDTHCRTPYFLRGKRGTVIGFHGTYADPEKLAYHKPGFPKLQLFMVQFEFGEVWPGRASGKADTIVADIYQQWLEADGGK